MIGEYGSLGCSGDLAPLAHCALAAMGEGEVRDADGVLMDGAEALAGAGLEPIVLQEKEGLALINGTDGMLAMLALAITDLRGLLTTADLAAAMSVEGLAGTDRVFAADLQALRPHPGQAQSAATMRAVLAGSATIAAHATTGFTRVQDAYSLRCAPQVHGAARDTVDHAAVVADRELASAIDNPVVTLDGRLESNGNFHGAPIGYVLDFLAIAAADVASMSERRTDRFLDKNRNGGLDAVPGRRPGRRLRPHDRPVHSGRNRQRAQAPGGPGVRRLDPHERDAGGPRLDGLVRGAQAAALDRRAHPSARDRADDRRPRHRHARREARTGDREGHRPHAEDHPRSRSRPVPRTGDRRCGGPRRIT